MISTTTLLKISDKINNKEYGADFRQYTLERILISELWQYLPLFKKIHWETPVHPMTLAKVILKNHPKYDLNDADVVLELLCFLELAKVKIVFRGHYIWFTTKCLATYTLIHNVYIPGDILQILFAITRYPSFATGAEASKITSAFRRSKVYITLHFLRDITKTISCPFYRMVETIKY